jgi:2-dehydro-3-deoxyphosphogluconate aldolase/(4S)-4-hydroxy-2-oxoglutarate aldolase
MLGPDFLKGIKDIFPKLLFMPTGGVDTTRILKVGSKQEFRQ